MAAGTRRRPVRLIGAAIGIGGPDAGCALAPARLRAAGLAEALAFGGVLARWGPIVTLSGGYEAFCRRVADEARASLAAGEFPVVIGGDHSCAVGTWRGIAAALRGALGLVWIDAHMDAHTRDTTPSGNLHGMPLAALLEGGTLAPGQVSLIGVRSFEPEEARLLARLGVRVFHIDEVARRGLPDVMDEALAIATQGTAGFGVSLDIDALDPEAAPAVSVPCANGLQPDAVIGAMRQAAAVPGLVALELVEYNPAADRDDITASIVMKLLAAGMPASVMARRAVAESR